MCAPPRGANGLAAYGHFGVRRGIAAFIFFSLRKPLPVGQSNNMKAAKPRPCAPTLGSITKGRPEVGWMCHHTFRPRSLPMLSIAELHPALHDLFTDAADHLARAAGFCQRARKLTGPVFAQALV